jgi:hypothetical protein
MTHPKHQPSDSSEGGIQPTPEHSATRDRAALGGAGGGARSGAQTDSDGRRGDPEGTPPCNTVPSNDNPRFKLLRFGVDSLYLSYPGKLSEVWDVRLDELKTLAQSDNEAEQAQAQVAIGSHLFEVRDKGMPRFPYVLADNCFLIKLNRKSKTIPMAHVQISSEYLAAVGIDAAEKDLRIIVNTLGLVTEPPRVSRADLFTDFVCSYDLGQIEQPHWITRAAKMAKYYDTRQPEPFTGWVIGIGGSLHARLYEKTVEVATQSHKNYLYELWAACGWQPGEKVWRMEFQIDKQPLKELGVVCLSDLLEKQAPLWRYLTHDWLRLASPNPHDSKRSRWPNHPLWNSLSGVFESPHDQPRLSRFRPARLPADERLFVHGLGGLTSFMASRGIEDFGEGVGEYLHQAQEYHAIRGEPLLDYTQRKVKAKGRKYNAIRNAGNLKEAERQLDEAVRKFKRVKDEGDGDA